MRDIQLETLRRADMTNIKQLQSLAFLFDNFYDSSNFLHLVGLLCGCAHHIAVPNYQQHVA